MMSTSSYVKRINDYKKCMRVLECAHSFFVDEIYSFDFKRISKYKKSKHVYNKVAFDFERVNELIKEEDLFNAATVLRTLYENIIYIIATSYDKSVRMTLDTAPIELRTVLENNIDILFTNYFEKKDFNNLYKYLCKIIHPSSMKELVAYLNDTIKYKNYMLNNLKYIMVIIEYMYLNYLNKRVGNIENEFDLNFIDYCTYVNLVNISYYLSSIKDGMNVVKRFMYYDTNNKYVEDNKKICLELAEGIKKDGSKIEKNIMKLTKELDKQISESKYKDIMKY